MRSCYKVPMRFFPDQPDRLVGVTWYFVPNDRPFVPWPHAFGTRVWSYQTEDDPPYGELNGPRPWYGGQVPATAGSSGICGDSEQWLNGCGPDDSIPPPWPGSGVCSKCGPPQLRSSVGADHGTAPAATFGCCTDLSGVTEFFAQYQGPATYPNLPIGTVVRFYRGNPSPPAPPTDPPFWICDPFPWNTFSMVGNFSCVDLPSGNQALALVWTDVDSTILIGSTMPGILTCDPFRLDLTFTLQPDIPPLAVPCYWRVTATPP